MNIKGKVIPAVYSAIDEVNQLLSKELRINKSLDSVIVGKSGKLDSVGFVNLIVAVEEKIEEKFGLALTLANVMSENIGASKTIGTLVDYICLLLEKKTNG